jgi:hypothetical protein
MQEEHVFDELAVKTGTPVLNVYGEALSRTPALATTYDVSDVAAWMTVDDAVSRFGKADDRCSKAATAVARADVRLAFCSAVSSAPKLKYSSKMTWRLV